MAAADYEGHAVQGTMHVVKVKTKSIADLTSVTLISRRVFRNASAWSLPDFQGYSAHSRDVVGDKSSVSRRSSEL